MTDSRTYQFPVEAGQVLQFARAVGEIDLREDQPGLRHVRGRTPSPTFLIGSDVFDPLCPRRPVPGETYRVAPNPGGAAPQRRGFHARQTFEFRRHPRIGEVLSVETGTGRTWSRAGSTGNLNFTEHISAFTDSGGERVATTCWLKVIVTPSTRPEPAAQAERQRSDESADAGGVPAGDATADVATVETWSEVVVPELTLSHLVMYAGASGDYIPMHHDDRVSRAAGYPGVFAHGMWTMGVTARAFSRAVPTENLRRYSARMHTPVVLGDTLTTEVVATLHGAGSASSGTTSLELATRNQAGELVLSAQVVADGVR